MPCEAQNTALQGKIGEITAAFQSKLQAIGDRTRNDAGSIDPKINTNDPLVYVGLNFDVRWKQVAWSMDLPTVELRDQKFALDLPEVTMKRNDISWDVPVPVNKRVPGPPYPEFKCEGFPPQCTVTWSPTWLDLPVIEMRRQEMSMDLPEVKMKRQDIIIGVPMVKMQRQDFSFDVPEFILKNVSVEAEKAKQKGEKLATETQVALDTEKQIFKETAKADTGAVFSKFVDCQAEYLTGALQHGLGEFNKALGLIQSFISGMIAQKVPADNPQHTSLIKNMTDTTVARDAFETTMHKQLEDLPKMHQRFIDGLMAG